MYRMRLLVLAALAATSAVLFAQTPTVTVFEGARVIIGDGRAPIENATFIVSGNRFTQVGRAGDVKASCGRNASQPCRQDRDADDHRHAHASQPNSRDADHTT